MLPKISVIIPVYNVEKYLNRCIESILSQSLQDFEIILINDGSTDSSPEICNNYAKKDNRIKVIHKKNSRVAAARNDGMKVAKGEYISFVDSDDWIESNMYKIMYEKAKELEVDIIMCDYMKRGKNTIYTVSQPINGGFYNKERIEEELYPNLIMFEKIEFPATISNCTCLFKNDFIKRNNLYYDERIHYCEDSIFGSIAMYNANKFYYLKDNYLYNYFYNSNSTTTTYNKNKWDAYLLINNELEKYFKNKDYDFSRQIKINMLYFTLNMLSEIGRANYSFNEKRKFCSNIMNNKKVKNIFKDFNMPRVNKGLTLVSNLCKYRLSWIYSLIFYKKLQ